MFHTGKDREAGVQIRANGRPPKLWHVACRKQWEIDERKKERRQQAHLELALSLGRSPEMARIYVPCPIPGCGRGKTIVDYSVGQIIRRCRNGHLFAQITGTWRDVHAELVNEFKLVTAGRRADGQIACGRCDRVTVLKVRDLLSHMVENHTPLPAVEVAVVPPETAIVELPAVAATVDVSEQIRAALRDASIDDLVVELGLRLVTVRELEKRTANLESLVARLTPGGGNGHLHAAHHAA